MTPLSMLQGTQASALDISSADDVAACLTAGTLSHCHALSLGAGCYWAYAVRRRVLIDFFQVTMWPFVAHTHKHGKALAYILCMVVI